MSLYTLNQCIYFCKILLKSFLHRIPQFVHAQNCWSKDELTSLIYKAGQLLTVSRNPRPVTYCYAQAKEYIGPKRSDVTVFLVIAYKT